MVDLLEAGGLRLVEVAPPVIPAELRTAMDREWGDTYGGCGWSSGGMNWREQRKATRTVGTGR